MLYNRLNLIRITTMDFPIKTKEYLHGEKVFESDLPDDLAEEGWTEKQLESLPRYLVYELELDVEIAEDGTVTITHVAGYELPEPIVNS